MPVKLQVDAKPPRQLARSRKRSLAWHSRTRGGTLRRLLNSVARWVRGIMRWRKIGGGNRSPRKPRGPYYAKLALATLGMGGAYWFSAAYLQLYLDQQPITSIQNSRWYLMTKWNPYPQERGELSAYSEFMQPLLQAPLLRVQAYEEDDLRREHSLYLSQQLERLRTQWTYYVAPVEFQTTEQDERVEQFAQAKQSEYSVHSEQSVLVKQSELITQSEQAKQVEQHEQSAHPKQSGQSDQGAQSVRTTSAREVEATVQQGNLIPTDQLLLPRGAAREVRYQLYVFRNEQLIPAFPASQRFVKFVVGYRGDVVMIFPHAIYVNNVWIRNTPEPVAQQLRLRSVTDPLHRSYRVVQLQAQQYWVMGDDPDSIDSSYFGPVARDQFVGKVAWHF